MNKVQVLAGVVLLSASIGWPQSKPALDSKSAQPIIVAGMDALKAKGPEEAVKAWLKSGPMEGDKDAASQAGGLRRIQDYYGSFVDFDVVSLREVSPKVRYVYIIMNFEKGPVFSRFNIYKNGKEWMITSFNFNTKEEAVFLPAP